ncbi:CLUMA_CG000344, isoform A [Clunio marinus]|uniref:CLUMA_CG000344, isoform A n=1 Tax=Clunio marinus TaxID=568069 RepID=A0A1J1HEF0_9DIPT|nr:CLUMA_CG000344, isoform A [Clunio marinus]
MNNIKEIFVLEGFRKQSPIKNSLEYFHHNFIMSPLDVILICRIFMIGQLPDEHKYLFTSAPN